MKNLLDFLYPENCRFCHLDNTSLCTDCFPKINLKISSLNSVLKINNSNLGKLLTIWHYKDLKDCLKLIKLQNDLALLKILIRNLPELVIVNLGTDYDYIIPLPSNPTNTNKRLFNVSNEISKVFKVKSLPKAFKYPATNISQSKKTRQARLEQVFEFRSELDFEGKRLLLLDDVITTGASLRSAVILLLNCKPKHIEAVCLAQTL